MNQATAIAQSSPRHTDCHAAAQVTFFGVAIVAITVTAMEAWLRVPLHPVLNGYLQEALRVATLATAIRKSSL